MAQWRQPALVSAFPVVVTALIVERWWNAFEADGPKKAMRMTTTTLAVALMIQCLVAAPPVLLLAAEHPLALPLSSIVLMIVLGNLRGWRYVNAWWFRLSHLATIGVVVAQSWLGMVCPLTTLELWLRAQAGHGGLGMEPGSC